MKYGWQQAPTNQPPTQQTGCSGCSTTRDYSFYVKDGVKIYGGFSASSPEATLAARSITANVTALSADFNDNDVVTGSGSTLSITSNTENAYHVVLASAPSSGGIGVTIDGFSIIGGNSNVSNTFISVTGNIFYRDSGSGIFTYYGTNTLANNTLSGNAANYYGGGGICTRYGTNTLINNTLSENSAYFGGGIYIRYGSNTLTNNTLSGNLGAFGGGIYTYFSTNTLINNTLSENAANEGGGIFTDQSTNTLTNILFWANTQGGANNVAGADIYNNGASNTVTYCLTQQNSTYSSGTGIINNQDPLFVDAANIAGADGIHRTADDGLQLQAGSPAIDAGDPAVTTPTTDITGTTRTGVFDMGAYEYFVSCPTATTLYVDASIGTSGNGETWATAFKTLDEALAIAHCCSVVNTIEVAAGTYKPTKKPYNGCTEMTTTDARDLTFHLPDDLTLRGGYPNGGGTQDVTVNVTTLSGDFNDNDVVTGSGSTLLFTGNTENAYHVVLASANATTGIGVTVDGFSIKGGRANAYDNYVSVNGNDIYRDSGGGIYTYGGTNTQTHNTLSENYAYDSGGGIFTYDGSNTLTHNTLSGNGADLG